MTIWTVLFRGLWFHRRTHLGVLLGAAAGTAILVGALAVGDSVRFSLREMAGARLGRAGLALDTGDRTVRVDLASEIDPKAVAALLLPATGANPDTHARANEVHVLGVDADFWKLAAEPPQVPNQLTENEAILNEPLARQLHVQVEATVVLRAEKPSPLPRDAILSSGEDTSIALRVKVKAIIGAANLGTFSLRAGPTPPFNAWVSRTWLQKAAGLPGRANLILLPGDGPAAVTTSTAQQRLRDKFTLADAQLELRPLPTIGAIELRGDRIFLENPEVSAAQTATQKLHLPATAVLTYFVNELRVGDRTTPYSIVSALGSLSLNAPATAATSSAPPTTRSNSKASSETPVPLPPHLADDEAAINQWLADDLGAKIGDRLTMKYYVLGNSRRLEERSRTFRVSSVLPMDALDAKLAGRELMPLFPGLHDAENSDDWKPGFHIDLTKVRAKDKAYWKTYRGTPKAFISLGAAQSEDMWANRFGSLTAVRFAAEAGKLPQIAAAIRDQLDPAALGLTFRDVRGQAATAATGGTDFGMLFVGFSFFLIIAALVLVALLFSLGIEQRSEEVGTLLAVGWRPGQVQRLFLGEGLAIAVVGAAAGTLVGVGYTKLVLAGLMTFWHGAVADSSLQFHVEPLTLATGGLGGVSMAAAALAFGIWRHGRQSVRELLYPDPDAASLALPKVIRRRISAAVAIVCTFAAAILVLTLGQRQRQQAAEVFFSAGSLTLMAGLAASAALLSKLAAPPASRRLNIARMSLLNTARRRGRSLATITLLACGSFLVVAVGANRQNPTAGADQPSSGTGGFALLGQSALPIVYDLNTADGRAHLAVPDDALAGTKVVGLRVHEGDDASCLNLNQAQSPRLLGADPKAFRERGAFTFKETDRAALGADGRTAAGWDLLDARLGPDIVPAVGDEQTVTWGLKKKLGEVIPYTDDRGKTFQVKIVGIIASSILQGSLLIPEREFTKRFPSESGYRILLIDAPPSRAAAVQRDLSAAMENSGLEISSAPARLAMFHAVENTYLAIFQALGGLGLALGSVGLGVIVLRNVLERRAELAILRAVGFRQAQITRLVLVEHWLLFLAGVVCGTIAAAVAVLPAVLSGDGSHAAISGPGATTSGAAIPFTSVALTLMAVVASGFIWTVLATRLALRGPLLSALRNE